MGRRPETYITATPSSSPDSPLSFMSNVTGRLGSMEGELDWRLIDFWRIHQIVYEKIAKVDAQLDALGVEHIKFHDDPHEIENVYLSRLLSAVIGKDRENKRIVSFVDSITVVGLWVIAEQFLGKVYRGIRAIQSGQNADQVRSPYRWERRRLAY